MRLRSLVLWASAALALLSVPAFAQNPAAPPETPVCNGQPCFTPTNPGTVTASGGSAPMPYEYTDLGPCQLTVGNSATGLTGGTGICSGGIPAGATIAVITVETQPIRWTGTGATNPPTQSFGSLQGVGTSFTYSAALANFRMNDTASGSSTVDVEFFK